MNGSLQSLKTTFSDIWLDDVAFPAVEPTTTEQVMQIMNWCRSKGWRVLPVGRGNSFGEYFQVPSGVLTVITLSRDGVSEPDPLDLVIEVESGVPANDLLAHVREYGFRLDDWPEDYSGTVGGVVCGENGPGVRHLILGADIIDGRGRALRFGGRVRKNVSGFDVASALAGSRGALAWVDRLYLRLTPDAAQPLGRTAYPPRTAVTEVSHPVYKSVIRALDPDSVFFWQGQ